MVYWTRKNLHIAFFVFIISIFSGCDVARQAQKATNLANCDFRILSVDQVDLAGVELQQIRSIDDLSMMDVARILAGFTSPVFPLSLRLILEGRNPNPEDAGLNSLEWILFIDDIQMTSGTMDTPVRIPPLSSASFPVEVGIDLKQVLSGKSTDAMVNFCLNLTGNGSTPTRFKIKLKPTVIISGRPLTYPGYITVRPEFVSK